MNPTLRPAVASDAAPVARLLIDTRATCMSYVPPARSNDEVVAWVATRLVPSGGVVVAEVQCSIAGAMHSERKEGSSWIAQMAVDPQLVGKGIGSLLLAHAVSTMLPPIRLWTFQANVNARRFYDRRGFVAIEFTDGQRNEEGCPDVLYELSSSRS
jgi:GNAT superfamily N-acetyltransferase